MACVENVECAEVSTGCCLWMTVTEVAEDAYFEYGEELYAGDIEGSCVSAEFEEALGGEVFEDSIYNGFCTWFGYANEAEMEAIGAYGDETCDDYLDSAGADFYTLENSFASWECAADSAATTLAAGAATTLAAGA